MYFNREEPPSGAVNKPLLLLLLLLLQIAWLFLVRLHLNIGNSLLLLLRTIPEYLTNLSFADLNLATKEREKESRNSKCWDKEKRQNIYVRITRKEVKMGKVKLHAGLVMSHTVVLHSLNFVVSTGFPFLLSFLYQESQWLLMGSSEKWLNLQKIFCFTADRSDISDTYYLEPIHRKTPRLIEYCYVIRK